MKRVLIIGAKGMLGQELVRVFLADRPPHLNRCGGKNYKVFAWDRDEIDITDEAQVKDKVGSLAPQIIINAAAYNAVDKCEEPAEFELAKKINGLAPGYLAEVAKELGAIFVHYSSDYVFDGDNERGYKENDAVSPISNYGISKALGEKEVRPKGGKYYIIRLQKLFGRSAADIVWPSGRKSQRDKIQFRPGLLVKDRRNFGSGTSKKSFFETMLALAETKKEFDMVDEELANFTYAPDLARRAKYIIENNLPFGIYHVINEGKPVTWFGAAKILFELAGRHDIKLNPVPAAKFPRPAKRPKYAVLLNTKLPALRPWEEALKEFLHE